LASSASEVEAPPRSVNAPVSALSARFVKAIGLPKGPGHGFDQLVTDGLASILGETCAYATVASLGRRSLEDPGLFAEKLAATFGFQANFIIDSLIAYSERETRRRVPL